VPPAEVKQMTVRHGTVNGFGRILGAVAVALLLGAGAVRRSPHYDVVRFAHALRSGDPEAALEWVDVPSVAASILDAAEERGSGSGSAHRTGTRSHRSSSLSSGWGSGLVALLRSAGLRTGSGPSSARSPPVPPTQRFNSHAGAGGR